MKRTIALLMAVLLCMAMAAPVYAAEQEFVPSITYKDGLEAESAEMNGEDVIDCIVVTSIKEAKEQSTDITQEARDQLLDVYEKLSDGTMKLPLEGDYVVVELVDISFAKSSCVDDSTHGHDAWLKQEGNKVTVRLGQLNKNLELKVFSYYDGQWHPVENVTNNGDGTFTCEFESVGPVAFCAEGSALEESPATGDTGNVFLWLAVMLVSAAALVATLVFYRRRAAK